jgi:hypothetical protein
VLALAAFKGDAEGFLEGELDAVESGEWVGGGAGASLAGVGGEQPGEIFGLLDGNFVEEDAREVVGERLLMLLGELVDWRVPEGFCGGGQVVGLEGLGCAGRGEAYQAELVIVGDEDEAEVAEIAEDLLRLCEGWEGVSGWLDFNPRRARGAGRGPGRLPWRT